MLFWALNFVPTLGKPDAICDVSELISIMQERSAIQFISDAIARPISELLDQADLIYRYRWAIVNAQLKGQDCVADLNFSVALERHYALNWLIHYFDQDCDDIGVDT